MAARWPDLASYLAAAEVEAVQAHPLRWHGQVLGAVNVFYGKPVTQTEERVTTGQAFADMATLILLTPHDITAQTSSVAPPRRSVPGPSSSRPRGCWHTRRGCRSTGPTNSSSSWPRRTD